MLKVTLDENNNIIHKEVFNKKEVFVDFDISENIVVDSKSGTVVRYIESTQAKEKIQKIISRKDIDQKGLEELAFLLGSSLEEAKKQYSNGVPEIKPQNQGFKKIYKAIINVTTDNKKKKCTLITDKDKGRDTVEYYKERGDEVFKTYKEAQARYRELTK